MKTTALSNSFNGKSGLLLFVVVCLFSSEPLRSQDLPVYSVTCPEASELGEYGAVPVSHYTGIPNISIPLYEIRVGKYTIPVSADYHLASVRPNDPPGTLGLGWTLMAGGVISRSVRGVYDEKKGTAGVGNGFYWHTADLKKVSEEGVQSFDQQTKDCLQSETSEGWYELSADEFSFNFLGYSGNFYINEDGGWTVVSDCDIKVEFDPKTGFAGVNDLKDRIPDIDKWPDKNDNTMFFKEFTLVTPDGCRYVFGGLCAMDFCIPYYSRNTDGMVVTSWHLSKIVTPEGYEVNYSYLCTGNNRPVMVDLRYVPSYRSVQKVIPGSGTSQGTFSYNTGRKGFTGFLLYGCDLQTITTPNETISLFYYADLNYGTAYSKYAGEALYWTGAGARQTSYFAVWPEPYGQFLYLIKARSGSSPSNTRNNIADALRCNVLHRIAIASNYSDGHDMSIYLSQSSRSRRKLSGIVWRAGIPPIKNEPVMGGGVLYPNYVIPENDSGVDMPEYKFSYNPGTFPYGYVFPQTDQWGYYNGKTNSPSGNFDINKPVAESNLQASQYETLTEIQYPTGGSTVFEYEGNDYSRKVVNVGQDPVEKKGTSGGLRIKSITNTTRDGEVIGITRYRYTESIDSYRSSGIEKLNPPFTMSYSAQAPDLPNSALILSLVSAKGFPASVTNMNTPYVGYSSVIEESLDASGNSIGYIKYSFSNFGKDIYGISHNDEPAFHSYNCLGFSGVPYTSRSIERGRLLSKQYFTSDGVLVREEKTRYKKVCNDSLLTADQRLVNFTMYDEYVTSNMGWLTWTYTYSYLPYSTEIYQYDDGEYYSKEECDYNDQRLISSRTVLTSDNSVRQETYKYPADFPEYIWMSGAHILSPPVLSKVSCGSVYSSVRYHYADAGTSGKVLPYVNRIDRSTSEHPAVWTDYKVISVGRWGNPTEIVQDGRHTILMWGYMGQVFEIKIDNMTRKCLDSLVQSGMVPSSRELILMVDRKDLAKNGALVTTYSYNGNLQVVKETAPDGVETFYDYDVLRRLKEQYFIERKSPGSSKKKTVQTFVYRYDETGPLADAEKHKSKSLDPPGVPIPPENPGPIKPVEPVPVYMLETGYSVQAVLKWFQSGLNDPADYMCDLKCNDTVTVNFKITDFAFNRGLGDPLPERIMPLRLSLLKETELSEEVIAHFPFEVNGSTLECIVRPSHGDGDSVVHRLPPGTYKLKYQGVIKELAPLPPGGTVSPATSVIQAENTSITVVMECLPLIVDDPPVNNHSRNSITSFVSSDGSDSTGMYTKIFYDDFGRFYTKSLVDASPSGNTLITLQEYDGWGRKSREWLPGSAPVESGYVPPKEVKNYILSTYPGESAPYSYNVYEPSPLSRVVASYGPGAAWQDNGKAVRTSYLVNSDDNAALECLSAALLWIGETPEIKSSGLFEAGTLSVVLTEDEDGMASYTFTDRLGRCVMTRQVSGGGNGYFDTHYICDKMDRLVAVLPPALSSLLYKGTLSLQDIDRYAFIYRYDSRGRNCVKKIPGKENISYVFDSADRVIYEQDGECRKSGKSVCYLYDMNGRECVRLLCSKDISFGEEIDKVVTVRYTGSTGKFMGYDFSSGASVDVRDFEILSVNYYDIYSFEDDFRPSLPSFDVTGTNVYPIGQKTGSFCTLLDAGELTSDGVWSSIRYDFRGRTVQMGCSCPSGQTEAEHISYDFVGNPISRRVEHRHNGETTTEDISYSYDSQERLLDEKHSLDGQASVSLLSNTYDVIGRVSKTERGCQEKFTETRTYNVRSWIKSLSSGLFSETLYYNEPRVRSAIPRYDGFVSSMEWYGYGDNAARAYDFTYDKTGRLTDARYSLLDTMSSDEYGASYSYDSQGNLLTIERRCSDGMNQGRVDRLSLTYDGNRLLKSSGAGSLSGGGSSGGAVLPAEYTYDADGNMTSDPYRGVRTISYDISDHIAKLDSDSAVVSFGYLASGVKMSRKVETSSDTVLLEYVGNVVMEDGRMKYLLVDGGYIDFTSGTPVYMYYFKDHLGSNRVVASQSGSVEQVNHYYPYGLSFPLDSHTSSGSDSSVSSAGVDDQPWKYSGNELMSLGGLSVYDFNARTYDQSLGRFLSIDPLAENYYSVSPYAFCSNNPVNFVDPDGSRVLPRTNSELEMIRMTLPESDREYVVLGANGYIDHNVLSGHESNSGNYNSLLSLSEGNTTVFVLENDTFTYKSNGNIESKPMSYDGIEDMFIGNNDGAGVGPVAGDSGLLGKTLLPDDAAMQRSPDSNIYVIVNSGMSDMSKSEMFAHEGYGHALVYVLSGDYNKSSHQYGKSGIDLNRYLFDIINRAMNETVNNNR